MENKTYRKAEKAIISCITCKYSSNAKPFCKKWLKWIEPDMVCNSFVLSKDKLRKEYINARRQATSRGKKTD
jgi:hypothetical protein